ncbi:hypothetical protein KFE25_011987 [Diacronema lutheri]|uniref:Uncharacterized protein n=1 Tax=Diacronema lutheri TaxID=2081491 RepID=A0A8J5X486_DIALT|nr:hypothetical protein KFE25_011987 [Diacronema lutheri]
MPCTIALLLGALSQTRPPPPDASAAPRAAPEAVIHIGPHKTASTTLELALLRTLRSRLERDDGLTIPIDLPGSYRRHKNHANLAVALHQRARRPEEHEAWLAFVRAAQTARASGSNLVISSEGLATIHASRAALLTSALGQLGFARVRIVIVHRRLYDKLASVHSQMFMRIDKNVSDYQPIADWLDSNPPEVRLRFNETVALRDMHTALGARVSVLHMAAVPRGSSIVTEFICEHLRAERTCARLRSGEAEYDEVANARPRAHAPLFDLVYAAARARGLDVVRNAQGIVAALAERDLLSRPRFQLERRCPSAAVQSRLLRATESEERALAAPGALSAEQVRELRGDFASKSSGILCAAEVAAAAKPDESAWSRPLALAFKQAAIESAAAGRRSALTSANRRRVARLRNRD